MLDFVVTILHDILTICHIGVTILLKYILDVPPFVKFVDFPNFQTYIEIFEKITETNWATVIVSVCCIVFLVIGKVCISSKFHIYGN